MKNPNGYGTVVRLSGNRRRPYAVRKTKGFNPQGYAIYLNIGYAATREEAMILLASYNKSPYNLDNKKITVSEVYEKWHDRAQTKLSPSLLRSLEAAWKHCSSVYTLPYIALKTYTMQDVVDNCTRGEGTKANIKSLFTHLDDYANEVEISSKKFSEYIDVPPRNDGEKTPFTDAEIQVIWDNIDLPWVDSILCLLYTGWRITELLKLKMSDVDTVEWTLKGGIKTKNGKNRLIPIHPRIKPIIEDHLSKGNEYLFCGDDGKPLYASLYHNRYWRFLMARFQMDHTPHDCRHTFRSKLDSAGGNKTCIDLLMGHKSLDIGERVYTHKRIDELRETILLLK